MPRSALPYVALALAVAACSGSSAPSRATGPAPYAGKQAIAWRCSDLDLVFFPGETPARARIRINEEVRELKLRATSTGIEYGDDQVTFLMRGEEARIVLPDVERICLYDAARTATEDEAARAALAPVASP